MNILSGLSLFILTFITMAASNCSSPQRIKTPIKSRSVVGLNFIQIPKGSFRMGNEPFSLERDITVSSFSMSETEVTNRQYDMFRKRKRSAISPDDDMPVVGLSRQDALEFIAWLGKRDGVTYSLPTEAQWEYAARGGRNNFDYPWGDRWSDELALVGAGDGQTSSNPILRKVKSYPGNDYGLYDMCGNAGEMVLDSYAPYRRKGSKTDPFRKYVPEANGGKDPYVVRGLGVGHLFPQVWYRAMEFEHDPDPCTGFRLVKTSESKK